MGLKPGFNKIAKEVVSICRQLIWDTSPVCRSRLPTVTIIWKPGLMVDQMHWQRNWVSKTTVVKTTAIKSSIDLLAILGENLNRTML